MFVLPFTDFGVYTYTGSHWIENSNFVLSDFNQLPVEYLLWCCFCQEFNGRFLCTTHFSNKSENNCPQILTSSLSKKVCAWAFCLFCYYCLTLKLRQVSKSSARFGTSRTNTPSAKILILLETQVEWFLLNLKCIYMHASHLLTTGKFNKINLVITTMLGCCLCHLFEGRTGFLFKTALIAELLKTQNRRLSLRYNLCKHQCTKICSLQIHL